MAAAIKALLEKRANAWEQAKEIKEIASTEGRDLTAEERQKWDTIVADVESLGQQIEDEERSMRIDAVVSGAPVHREDGGARREGEPSQGEQYRAAMLQYIRRGMAGVSGPAQEMLEQNLNGEVRAQGTTPDAAGGYLVHEEFTRRLTEVVKAYGGLFAEAEILPTGTGASIPWPRVDDTANKGEIVAENTQHTELDVVFSNLGLGAHTYSSRVVRVSRQLLQDASVDVEGLLSRLLGARIGRALAEHLIIGNGTTQPEGILTGVTQTVTSGTVGKIGYKDLLALERAVDPVYRGRGKYMLSGGAEGMLQDLEDTTGRPLWSPSIAVGSPSTINGREYFVDSNAPAVAASSKSVVFGDFKAGYVIRDVAGSEILRLTERYADFLQVGFLGFHRYDAGVQDTSALAALITRAV